MADTERYPIDYDAVQKGDVISQDRLNELIDARPGTTAYQLAMLALCKQIEGELWDRGKQYTLRIAGGAIHILTDADAANYNTRGFEIGQRKQRRCFRRKQAVSVAGLTPDQAKQNDRELRLMGGVLAAGQAARRQINGEPYERKTPRLPGAPE